MSLTGELFKLARLSNLGNHAKRGPLDLILHLLRKRFVRIWLSIWK